MLLFIIVALVMMSLHSNRTVTKTEVCTMGLYFCDRPDHFASWWIMDFRTLD